MFVDERQRIILNLVRATGAASVRELARAVHTSDVTVRRDLRTLEADGLLDRTYGGAVIPDDEHQRTGRRPSSDVAAAEKATIAQVAADMVADGDTIIVGPGRINQEFVRLLAGRVGLTVVTNSLPVAYTLARADGVDVVLTGGLLHRPTCTLVGPALDTSLAGLRIRCAFLTGSGLTSSRGLSTANLLIANADQAIAATSERVVVLADYTKVGVDAMWQAIPIARMFAVVTDARAEPTVVEAIRDRGANVYVAPAR